MPAVNFSPIFNGWQGFTASGLPLAGGLIQTFQAGTSTPLPTYTTSVGNISNANPIVLDAGGRPPQEIWLDAAYSYKFTLSDSLSNPIVTLDNITGIDNSVPSALTEWVVTGLTPSYVNATTFTLAGNQVATFEVGRRVRYTLVSGQYTGSVVTSVFGAVTTVTLVTDSIPLDATLSAADVGFLDALKPSVPTAFKSPVTAPSVTTTGAIEAGTTLHAVGVATFDANPAGRITPGTYTPTLTSVTNVSGSTANVCTWLRVGSSVTVSGVLSCGATAAATSTELGISLPVASNFAAGSNCGGVAASGGAGGIVPQAYAAISADSANDRASLLFVAPTNLSFAFSFIFTYQVI